ncbi:MAG: hypothetical protein PWQ50_718 [Methanolobus sp.]|jgi:hypothetical protein|nr:hypothetical protein [Methanolobus sp.]
MKLEDRIYGSLMVEIDSDKMDKLSGDGLWVQEGN